MKYKSFDEFTSKYFVKSQEAKKGFQEKVDLLKLCGFAYNLEGEYFVKNNFEISLSFVLYHDINELKDVLRRIINEERIRNEKMIIDFGN